VDLLRIEFPELVFNQSNRSGFDVNLKGDLKAEGIRWLVKYLDYPPDDVYAIGDGYNDISMIKAVKHGIAMGNGFPEVKAVASYITTSVEAEGVSNALRHFHLI
jgi:hydroxymethylpyrimidine pyrophosphatase-like HAD family hydrolase